MRDLDIRQPRDILTAERAPEPYPTSLPFARTQEPMTVRMTTLRAQQIHRRLAYPNNKSKHGKAGDKEGSGQRSSKSMPGMAIGTSLVLVFNGTLAAGASEGQDCG